MKKKSIYKYAAEAGVPVGLYLTLMSACFLMSIKMPALPMLLLPLTIGFPFLLWALLRRISREEPSYLKLSSLWLGGIYTVIFGTLICMLLSGLYLVFVEPGFVGLDVNNAIDIVSSSPMAAEYEETIALMERAMEAHILPSGMEFLTTMGWLTCFMGSVVSLVIALLMTKIGRTVSERASA